jgi:2-haloacid dehalogenase
MAYKYQAVLFDLLSGLIDSWTVWDRVAGSSERGRAWRGEYLKLTYGCGAYRPYETLVAEAAVGVGLTPAYADRLEAEWHTLAPWPGVAEALGLLRSSHRLGVVTNCSERLGRAAAERVGVPFELIVTSARAGFYKPDPRPYRLALAELGLPPERVLFVAGSGFDLFGTGAVGLDTYWHNHVGMAAPAGAPRPLVEARDLAGLVPLARTPG